MYVFTSLSLSLSLYVCMYVCIYIYIYTHNYKYIYIYIYIALRGGGAPREKRASPRIRPRGRYYFVVGHSAEGGAVGGGCSGLG